MNFFNFKNKKFLDMSKAEMISHSIVLVDDTKIVPIKEILQELPEIEAKVTAVGINFELFISKDDDENVRAKIFQNKINQGLESASTTLVYKIDDSCKLNLTIADANYKDTKGIYFKANFHITITSDNSLKEALKKEAELLKKANSKVEELLN